MNKKTKLATRASHRVPELPGHTRVPADCFAVDIYQFERVRTETVHVTVAVGCTAIGKKEHHLVNGFGS
uniref:Uncharacterized protein n=1 Tax=Romanomermis culicivorax TaxID=13658 RepID=A0A915JNX6_ROMCU